MRLRNRSYFLCFLSTRPWIGLDCVVSSLQYLVLAAIMASVHESMFFNPMMANGVVHANIFGIKDWVTPHKISILVLLHEMATCKGQGTPEVETRRLHMNKLNLPLLQGPDMTLFQLLKTIGECCPKLASAVSTRVKLMAEGELKDMENFFFFPSSMFSVVQNQLFIRQVS